MARVKFGKMSKQRRLDLKKEERLIQLLLQSVWGFSKDGFAENARNAPFRAYRDHFCGAFRDEPNLPETKEVINLIEVIKEDLVQIPDIVVDKIVAKQPVWLGSPLNSRALAARALAGVARLLLFTEIDVKSSGTPIPQLVENSLPRKTMQIDSEFSEEISAKTLVRVAGFEFDWTSDFSEHLRMHGQRVKFFRHATAVEQLEYRHEQIFPADFLSEVNDSIRLFFPPEGYKTRHWTRKVEDKEWVDLEAKLHGELLERRLEKYPYYGERLKIIQRNYDQSKPRHLKQWWYDRRRRVEWVGLQVAIFSFVVTAIFTIISAVTGILQVLKE